MLSGCVVGAEGSGPRLIEWKLGLGDFGGNGCGQVLSLLSVVVGRLDEKLVGVNLLLN